MDTKLPFFTILFSVFDDFIDFIKQSLTFTLAKSNALSIVIFCIKKTNKGKLTPQIVEFTKVLFEHFLQNPTNTSLHLSFLTLFKNLFSISDTIIDSLNLRSRIIEIYQKRYEINASYWGILLEISQIINDSIDDFDDNEEWNQFARNTIDPLILQIEKSYGGNLPLSSEYDFSDNSDSFDIDFVEDESPISTTDNNESSYEYYEEDEEDEEETTEDFHWSLAALIPKTNISKPIDIKLLSTLQRKKPIDFMKFSSDNKYLAIVFDGWLEMLMFPSLTIIFKMILRSPVISIFFTHDNSLLICCYSTKISFFNVNDGSLRLTKPIERCYFITLSPDITKAALLNGNGTQIYEFSTMKQISSFNKIQFEATYTTFSNQSDVIVTGYEDGSIDIYNINDKKIVKQILLFENSPITCLTMSNQKIFASSEETVVKLINNYENNNITELYGHTATVVTMDTKNNLHISGSEDNTVNVSQIFDEKMEYSLEAHQGPVLAVAFNNNGNMFASSGMDCKLRVWEIVDLEKK